jgi:hypothetical protein
MLPRFFFMQRARSLSDRALLLSVSSASGPELPYEELPGVLGVVHPLAVLLANFFLGPDKGLLT